MLILLVVGVPNVATSGADESLKQNERVKRELLVLFGNDLRESPDDKGWPRDTVAARRLQTPLEWMGYELHYHNLLKDEELESGDLDRYGGLIVDGSLHVPEVIEEQAARLIEAARRSHIPILIIGPYPFSSQSVLQRVALTLGLRGTGSLLPDPQTTGVLAIDTSMMNFEADVRPRNESTMRLQAPAGADVFLSIMARSASGESARFDPVFIADWGGMVLDPYLDFQPSEKQTLLLINLYEFLSKIWPVGSFPAPDPTTRNGMRVFLSHIDGDGFATLSHLKGGATCGEIIHERILKKYPYPVTVSVVEANLRGMELGLQPAAAPRMEQTAREVFELPYVEAATHTFSHPFVWLDSDLPYEEQYENRNLRMNSDVNYKEIDLVREIEGSADYVQSLLPEGKRVELVLWSGNCQPGPDAIRTAGDYGLGNMNGGDTVISKRYPGISGIAPRVMYWDDQIQVLAPNQNDFVYTRDWRGQSLTGFAEVIETFEMTETPRRLKPVNVYYHFYSGALLGPLSSLDRVYRWCESQKLHPLKASDYVGMILDSHSVQIFQAGKRRWRVLCKGKIRTFRMPVSAGVPVLGSCAGVVGFSKSADWHYIHTDGRSEVIIELGDPGHVQSRLYLDQSPVDLRIESATADSAQIHCGGAEGEYGIVLGGAAPDAEFLITINDSQQKVKSSAQGQLSVQLRGASVATLRRIE